MRLSLSLSLGLLLRQAVAASQPVIKEHLFGEAPNNIIYFEDSDVILASDAIERVTYRSDDAGASWEPLDGVPVGAVIEVLKHPYEKHTAVVLGDEQVHWITRDRGETWAAFETSESPSRVRPGIIFHARDPNRMIFQAQSCRSFSCTNSVYYTTDGFETQPKRLGEDRDDVFTCLWAQTTDLFTTGDAELDLDQILCVARGKFDGASSSNRVLISSDYFETKPREPTMSDGKTIQGVTNLAAVKRYIVFAAKGAKTTELAMYVTDDTLVWHRAEFGQHRLEEDAYTLLESTNYSMQVDVMTTTGLTPMGVLLTSNSNGTFFAKNIEHTNRNMQGFVDFEKISNIQGVVLVNTVDNWEEVELDWLADKEVQSSISFDDGRTWEHLTTKDGKRLHLHSVTAQRNMGRIYSSPAPGIVMGVGNTGKSLRDYAEGDLYVSDDAGLTWTLALDSPHFYEFGAQGSILVAIEDGETDEVQWSLDHGKTWDTTKLEATIRPVALTTTPDSTSLKFLLIASKGRGSQLQYYTYALDFNEMHERDCKNSDFENWPARVDADGKPTCVMGQVQYFRRRKASASCVVPNDNFKDPEESREPCKCGDEDFECDYNFQRDETGKCAQIGPVIAPDGACGSNGGSFKGTSGYRLIPGNQCKGGKNLAEFITRDCSDTKSPPASGQISSNLQQFRGSSIVEYYYLEREPSSAGDDETIIMRTDQRAVWITYDHGKTWDQILEDEQIQAIYPHQYFNDNVYLITPSETVYYSKDRGKNFHTFEAPWAPNQDSVQVLSFHPKEKDWLIWTGGRDCSRAGNCVTVAHASTHGGETGTWNALLTSVRKCMFVYREDRAESDQLIYCEQYANEDPDASLELISSMDWFNHKQTLKRDVINFATMAEYIVVALRDEDKQSLKVDTSIDGTSFADARFPPNFNVPHQQAYTVLDSSTHAVFLHVTVNNHEDQQYGSIIKSNSNGTSYVLSASYVNRNAYGFVDFEKMQGIEGVAIINRVGNVDDVDKGQLKKLKTYITHNDGSDWALLGRPEDTDDTTFECSGTNDKCSLHLHGYTERRDTRDTFSSPSAIGLMMGNGNVGEFLGYKKNADTFITRDGGLSWHFVMPGNWMWEYGDQGSIIVIVKEDEPTSTVLYSLNEGVDWTAYKFSEDEMIVNDISTVPSDTSLNFLLWGKVGGQIATVNLDFSGLKERSTQCHLGEERGGDEEDYYLWSPKHPLSDDDCLFGHIAQYHRKKTDADCFNGRAFLELHNIKQNCSCVREDFECDYNYQKGPNGECELVEGLAKPDPAAACQADKGLREYSEVTGYRRIPLTTCQGGRQLDVTETKYPCPGWEEDFQKAHGLSGAGLFFAIVLPVLAAAAAGYWVWRHWDGKFGRIRLGDAGAASPSALAASAFDRDAPWIKYPVMGLAALVALAAATPLLAGSLWRIVSARFGRRGRASAGAGAGAYARPYTSRDSFARGRGSYAVVDPDEGELLGDESDEEV